ncbi:MAG TPA: hypothetical protein VE129_04480 [Thermoanaerobaculia bacterium]|nr:hypothetical protein [Thermoanaerobaculia bacterium]
MEKDPARELLRHAVATLAYRGGKAARGAPEGFETLKVGETTKIPGAILSHIGDLLDWAHSMAEGKPAWSDAKPLPWAEEVARFHASLAKLDAFLASDAFLATPPEKLFQGPIADALTHVGQIALLRRLGGGPVRSENYFKADIAAGRVGPEQAPPKREFD